jgi:hypothetical protein
MPRKSGKKQSSIFISHSSANLAAAQEVEAALHEAGFEVWLDRSDLRVGVLLGKELQNAIAASRLVVLIWSEAAKLSPWVITEILTSFHLDRFIVPCAIDRTEFPQFLSRSVHIDLAKDRAGALAKLPNDVARALEKRNDFPSVQIYQAPELEAIIRDLNTCQMAVLDAVGKDELAEADTLQKQLDPLMAGAEAKWPYDPTILNLVAYHRKNSYMINHWAEYCASRFPKDPLLDQARDHFFETLMINPLEYSALNGLGNIFLFQGELDAARFFVSTAIRCAKNDGVDYWQAKNDLTIIEARLNSAGKALANNAAE